MIRVGLAGWGDHESLYPAKNVKNKLELYARSFDLVEVDSTFYAVQPRKNFDKWDRETPDGFSFVVKANQEMTGHTRGKPYFAEKDDLYRAFRDSIEGIRESGKLKCVLFQYPPWFDCTRDHVQVLRETRERMSGIPCALEFRHQSWFVDELRGRTLTFMREQGWIHSICDEPQAGMGSVPIVPEATDPGMTIVRMHGRDPAGWQQNGAANWRDVRYLYRYCLEELEEWSGRLRELERQTGEICLIFNNNSGGDAADNARMLQALLGIPGGTLTPREDAEAAPLRSAPSDKPVQLDLF